MSIFNVRGTSIENPNLSFLSPTHRSSNTSLERSFNPNNDCGLYLHIGESLFDIFDKKWFSNASIGGVF